MVRVRRRLEQVWWFIFRNFLCCGTDSRGAWTPVSLSLCQQNTDVHTANLPAADS